ncbi:MAG: DEAD/DEAH box helicase, partial [Oceanococcaceae bacterium]
MLGLEDVFAADGPLAAAMPGYRPRSGQIDMALDIADAISHQSPLCAEAGTGVGKTFAYLVPLLLDGRRAIVATHTRNLQDQIYFGDVPRLKAALGVELDVALLKGRANYYCHYRADQARPHGRKDAAVLSGLKAWVAQHESGDLDQYDGLPADWILKPQVSSTSEN